jgi:hypothetical protein
LFPGQAQVETTAYDTTGSTITSVSNLSNMPGGATVGGTVLLWDLFWILVTALSSGLLIGPYLMIVFHMPALLAGAAMAIVTPAFAFEIYVILKGLNML